MGLLYVLIVRVPTLKKSGYNITDFYSPLANIYTNEYNSQYESKPVVLEFDISNALWYLFGIK